MDRGLGDKSCCNFWLNYMLHGLHPDRGGLVWIRGGGGEDTA